MSKPLATYPLRRAEHVFSLRQGGRIASGLLGNDEAHQVRFATALSELGREAVTRGTETTAHFTIVGDQQLQIEFRGFPRDGTTPGSGVEAARKLIGDLRVLDDDAATVRVIATCSRSKRAPVIDARALQHALDDATSSEPLEELRLKNEDLIATLDQLRERQEDLERLNGELEETNRGVMAMYDQLAGELEETNRGVVALYAELDDKSARLNEANQAKTRFLASVSHELRSPVNSIIGLIGVLFDPQSDALTSEQLKQLTLVDKSSRELLQLVNSLLDLARAESGRLQPEPTRFAVADVFAELRGSLRPLVPNGVELLADSPPGIVIETDRILFTHILRNLLTNALKFTTTGSVSLSIAEPSAYELEIAVTDTGIGIAPDDQERVFEEFYQIRGPLQSRHKGTGLGLPYARRVAEALGGKLTLQSRPGEGSTFVLSLPLHWEQLRTQSPSSPRTDEGQLVTTALIVDDDEGFRIMLRGLLQGAATRIVEASDGASGLSAMRQHIPDIVFLDLRMPDMDGGDVLAKMNEDPALRSIPAVIVTSTELTLGTRQTVGPAAALLSKSQVDRERLRTVIMSATQERQRV